MRKKEREKREQGKEGVYMYTVLVATKEREMVGKTVSFPRTETNYCNSQAMASLLHYTLSIYSLRSL